MFLKVVFVKGKNISLYEIDLPIGSPLDECRHRLRHYTYCHIGAKGLHDFSVHSIPQRLFLFKRIANCICGNGIALRPQELFKIHRKHLDFEFLRWD